MTITDISPSMAVCGQWVYILGSGFDLENTRVYFGDVLCETYYISSSNSLAAMVPEGCAAESNIRLVTGLEEIISSTTFYLRTITQPPTVTSVSIDTETEWVGIQGDNFVWNNTTVTVDGKSYVALVDAPTMCGFRKDVQLILTSVVIQTPFGSVTHSV